MNSYLQSREARASGPVLPYPANPGDLRSLLVFAIADWVRSPWFPDGVPPLLVYLITSVNLEART
ncbi:MAG: hypothetical protein HKL91_04735 [Candidatus Eremiobacteraeota bacterium]|nr:hypothetical protein [Candidatus Eremiobacteraeota bacterium]